MGYDTNFGKRKFLRLIIYQASLIERYEAVPLVVFVIARQGAIPRGRVLHCEARSNPLFNVEAGVIIKGCIDLLRAKKK